MKGFFLALSNRRLILFRRFVLNELVTNKKLEALNKA